MNNISLSNVKFDNVSLSFKVNESDDIAAQVRNLLSAQSDKKSPANDEKMMAKITAKLKAGKKLTTKEAHYLQQANPELYRQYLRIQKMAKAVENQLKNAKSKEEANDVILHAFSCVSDKDPYKEYVVAAINEVIKNFTSSDEYQKLPDTIEDAKKAHKSHKEPDDKDEDDDSLSDDGSFDPMSWSPLQDVIDSMPTFDSPA